MCCLHSVNALRYWTLWLAPSHWALTCLCWQHPPLYIVCAFYMARQLLSSQCIVYGWTFEFVLERVVVDNRQGRRLSITRKRDVRLCVVVQYIPVEYGSMGAWLSASIGSNTGHQSSFLPLNPSQQDVQAALDSASIADSPSLVNPAWQPDMAYTCVQVEVKPSRNVG